MDRLALGLAAVGACDLVGRGVAAIRVLRARFLLRDRSAAGLVRGVAAFVRLGMFLAFASRRILYDRQRIR